jgi:hypothetical protein
MILVYIVSFTFVVPVLAVDEVAKVEIDGASQNFSNITRCINDDLCDVINNSKSFVCAVDIANCEDVGDTIHFFDKVAMWFGFLAFCCVAGPMIGVILMGFGVYAIRKPGKGGKSAGSVASNRNSDNEPRKNPGINGNNGESVGCDNSDCQANEAESEEGKFNLKATGTNRDVNVGGDLTFFDDDRIKMSVSGQIDYDMQRKKVKDGSVVLKVNGRLWKRNKKKQCVEEREGRRIRNKEEYEQAIARLRRSREQLDERWQRQLGFRGDN